MGFNRDKRDPFGPRFGELMGKDCHAAITAANKKDRPEYNRLIEKIQRNLALVDSKTEWPEDIKAKVEATESMKGIKTDEPAPVAPKTKPAATRKGNTSANPKRTKKATKRSDGFGDLN